MSSEFKSKIEADEGSESRPGACLVGFLRNSPLADAIAAGELTPDAVERDQDLPRDVDLFDVEPPRSASNTTEP